MPEARDNQSGSTVPPWPADLESQALHAPSSGKTISKPQTEDLSLASVWQVDSPATADAALGGQADNFVYRRVAHPNARTIATKLARLHGGALAAVTAQGMSSIAAIALSVLSPGNTVWLGKELYGETTKLFTRDMARWNIATRVFDPCRTDELLQLAAGQADLVFIETITNPRLQVPDIAAVAQASSTAGGLLVVDNTFATHLLCRPLELGADLVIESLGKQVNGHSDGMLGLVCGRELARMQAIAQTIKTFGLASSPLDCYLTHRGLLSLALRMERACANAMALASALVDLPIAMAVDYPGLPKHAGHAVAARQLQGGFGWMLSFRIDADRKGVTHLLDLLQPEICFAPSLGDVNTTVSHPASTSHRGASPEERHALGIYEGTLRISCGIEPTDWLVNRFTQALSQMELMRK